MELLQTCEIQKLTIKKLHTCEKYFFFTIFLPVLPAFAARDDAIYWHFIATYQITASAFSKLRIFRFFNHNRITVSPMH